jgi:hypothetical protein
MLATLDKAKSNIGNVRGLNVVAVKLMTVHVTKMPLLQKARHFSPGGKTAVHIKYEIWSAPEPEEMLCRRNKFLILAGIQTLNLPASDLLNILIVLNSGKILTPIVIRQVGPYTSHVYNILSAHVSLLVV